MMVPWYEIAVALTIAVALLLAAVYSPFLLKKRLPRWVEFGMAVLGIALFAGVAYAPLAGHWPFRS